MDENSGVVTIFHGGYFLEGPQGVEYVAGKKATVFVDGDDYSEYKLCRFLRQLGYDLTYIRGIYYKAVKDFISDVLSFNGDGSVRHIAALLCEDKGVHVYVYHEPHFAEILPDQLGWLPSVNDVGEEAFNSEDAVVEEAGEEQFASMDPVVISSSESEGLKSVYEGDTDDEVGTPEGKDQEYISIIGARRKAKKKTIEEEIEYFGNFKSRKAGNSRGARAGNFKSSVKKTRARADKSKQFNVKHAPRNRSHRRWKGDPADDRNEGRFADADPYWFEDHNTDHAEIPSQDFPYEPTEDGATEHVGEDADPTPANDDASPDGTPNVGEDPDPTPANDDSDIDEAEKERRRIRRERRNASSRKYKQVHDSDLEDFTGWRRHDVSDDDFGPSGHSNRRGHDHLNIPPDLQRDSDDESENQDDLDFIPRRRVESDPRSAGESDIWFNPEWEDPYFQVKMRFTGTKQFKEAIAKYAIVKGAAIRTKKNDSVRQRYVCKKWCSWEILASYDKKKKTFSVKTYTWQHNCLSEYRIKKANSDHLAKHFLDRVRTQPFYKCRQIMIDALKELRLDVKYSMCYRVKNKILDVLEGNFKDDYAVVVGYAEYLRSVNPDNTVTVVSERKTRMPDSAAVFSRMYICLSVLKEGWKKCCRPIIGVDACWLKRPCKRVLLVACGKDGNDHMYPIAWAVVDGESYDTWRWFFELLQSDLELGQGEGITFMSDRHKGIMASRKTVFPKAVQRHCARHIHGNWSIKHGGDDLKNVFWSCSYSYYPQQWRKNMENLKRKSVEAYNDLIAIDRRIWSRAYFSTSAVSEDVTNNVSESFNSYIRDYRALPIISMMEGISDKMMQRRAEHYHSTLSWTTPIAPNAFARLCKRQDDAHDQKIVWDGHHKFRVQDKKYGSHHVVNMKKRICSCRYWQMNGIPCQHLLRCIMNKGWEPLDFVSHYYKKEVCLASYEHPIEATRGSEMWRNYNGEKLEPPIFRRRPGRPTVNRKPSRGEVKKVPGQKVAWLGRGGRIMHCKKCGGAGHNTRTCKNPAQTTAPTPSQTARMSERDAATTQNEGGRSQEGQGQSSRGPQKGGRKVVGQGSISRSNKEKNVRRAARQAEQATQPATHPSQSIPERRHNTRSTTGKRKTPPTTQDEGRTVRGKGKEKQQ